MPSNPSITDMHLFPIERSEERLLLLRDGDHLLRRFGQMDLVSLEVAASTRFSLRVEADEIWIILEGEARAHLVDRRAGSPSVGTEVQFVLSALEPQGVLIPFGVAHSFSSKEGARLLRISTHPDGEHPEDTHFDAGEIGWSGDPV